MKMKYITTPVLVTAAALLLTACSAGVDTKTVGMMAPPADPFLAALQKEYVDLAVAEDKEDDGADAVYFISKAGEAAAGKLVGPQMVGERMLPASAVDELTAARKDLVRALNRGADKETPADAARAQAMYDCWIQEQEENNQPKDIEACRTEYKKAFVLLKTKPKVMAAKPAPKPMAKPAPMPMPKPFTIYFDSDSADINDKGMMVIKDIIAANGKVKPSKVFVAGHTDTKGDADYNKGLSRHRAAAVSNTLMEQGGLTRKQIIRQRHGEANPAVPSGDGKNEAMNRRVIVKFMR